MKKLLLFALIIMASMQLFAQDMLVGSYNIRYKRYASGLLQYPLQELER